MKKLAFFLFLLTLGILPFFTGIISFWEECLIYILPLPFFLLVSLKNNIECPLNKIIIYFLLFLFFLFLSVLNSASLSLSVPKFFQFLSFFAWFIFALQFSNHKNLRLLNYLILLVSFLLCLLSFWYLLPFSKKPSSTMNLVYGTHGHNHLAEYLCFSLPLSLAFFINSKGRRKFFWGGLMFFFLISLALTFSRTSFLLLPLIVFLMIRTMKPSEGEKKLLECFFIFSPLVLAVVIFFIPLIPFAKEQITTSNSWLIRQTIKPIQEEPRREYWKQAVDGFKQKPFLGWGIGTFRLISQRFQKTPSHWSSFAHNFYLQLLCEAGIFAFLAFLAFIISAFRYSWKGINQKFPSQVGSFFALLFSSLHSFFDFSWEFPAIFLTFLTFFAFLVGRKQYLPESKKNIPLSLVFFLASLGFFFGTGMALGEIYNNNGDYEKSLTTYPFNKKVWLAYLKTEGEKITPWVLFFNKEDGDIYFLLGEYYKKRGEYEKAIEMFRGATIASPVEAFSWRSLEEIYEKMGKEKIILYQELASKIKLVRPECAFSNYYAKVLYKLGFYYYQNGEDGKVAYYWEEASRIAPQWSFFWVELANFYAEKGGFEERERVLKNCLKFYFPKTHCEEYLTNKIVDPVGFWQKEIYAIPDGN